jgi:hypothetical protein
LIFIFVITCGLSHPASSSCCAHEREVDGEIQGKRLSQAVWLGKAPAAADCRLPPWLIVD